MKTLRKEFRKYPALYLMLVITAVLVFLAFLGPRLAPNDPYEIHYDSPMLRRSEQFPLGTDNMGRCLLSRLMYGGFTTISITFLAVLLKAAAGCLVGITAALSHTVVDNILMRITDFFMALPEMVCIIALVGILGPGLFNTMLAMTLIGWTRYARQSYSLVRSISGAEYIAYARFSGVSSGGIVLRYLLPNILPQIVITVSHDLGSTLLLFAGLSLLGLGPQPPAAEWGNMLSSSKQFMQTAPWLMIYPGLCILVFVVCYNLLGDLLRDRFDPAKQ